MKTCNWGSAFVLRPWGSVMGVICVWIYNPNATVGGGRGDKKGLQVAVIRGMWAKLWTVFHPLLTFSAHAISSHAIPSSNVGKKVRMDSVVMVLSALPSAPSQGVSL